MYVFNLNNLFQKKLLLFAYKNKNYICTSKHEQKTRYKKILMQLKLVVKTKSFGLRSYINTSVLILNSLKHFRIFKVFESEI